MKDLWTIPLAGLVAGLAGFLFGFPALRLTGLYLALATFAIAVAMPSVIKRYEHFTGGGPGINLLESPQLTGVSRTDPVTFEQTPEGVHFLRHHIATFNDWLYFLSWSIALVLFAVAWLLLQGRFGRSLRAVRDSELAAASFGVNLARYKTLAFGISAFYAGVAGSLLAIATTFVNPDTFPVALSIFLLVGVVVGGLGSLWPLVFGAIFIHFMQIGWRAAHRGRDPELHPAARRHRHRRDRRARGRVRRRADPDHARFPSGAAGLIRSLTVAVRSAGTVALVRAALLLLAGVLAAAAHAPRRATTPASRRRRSCSARRRRSPVPVGCRGRAWRERVLSGT